MYKVHITPVWNISNNAGSALDMSALMGLLSGIEKTGSIARAAESAGLSYRYAWGLLREGEVMFNDILMIKTRGQGTRLSALAENLIWAERRVAARLTPTLDSLSSELETELNRNLPEQIRPVRLHASHGFAVAALLKALNQEQFPVEIYYRNSTDAVAALARRECDLAGFHIPLGDFESAALAQYAQWLDPKTHCLIHLALRTQGLFVAAGNPRQISGIADLSKSGINFVNRQKGSGTRMLLDLMLARQHISVEQINGYDTTELTHSAVAAFIASGMADAGFGVQTAAQRFGLDFIALARERYFFALPKKALTDPVIEHVIAMLQSDQYRTQVNQLAGYDAADTGRIFSISEAFGKLAKP